MTGGLMNWKGSGRKWSWPDQDNIPAFASRDDIFEDTFRHLTRKTEKINQNLLLKWVIPS
jgi:hypothetical protein